MSSPQNDIFYTAALLEYVARRTHNTRRMIAEKVGIDGIRQIFSFADVSHCLSFEETSDEVIEQYSIGMGDFEPEKGFSKIPSYTAIGKNYANIVTACEKEEARYPEVLHEVLCSKISEWMTLYDNAFYYSTSEYQTLEFLELRKQKQQ